MEHLRHLRDRLRSSHDRLRALPLWFRLPLHVSIWSLFALGPATRIAYWLVVGTMTEAWPWQLWGEPYLAFIDVMLNERLSQVYLLVLAAGFAGIGWPLRSPPARRKLLPRLAMGLPQGAMILLAVAALTVLSPLLAVNSVRLVRTWPPRTDHLLRQNCGHCHSPYRPQHYIKPPEMWRRTVRRMIERNKAPVSDAKAEKIIAWLQDYRSFGDAWMFRAKCERCHHRTHLLERDRTADEWAAIIDRVGWLNGFAYREDQKIQMKRYTAEHLAADPPPEGTEARAVLERRLELQRSCNPCHAISLVLEEGALDDPRAMVERMSRKNPTLVPPDRVDALTKACEELPKDADGFWELFPHDVFLELDR
jgi:predicted secreted protein